MTEPLNPMFQPTTPARPQTPRPSGPVAARVDAGTEPPGAAPEPANQVWIWGIAALARVGLVLAAGFAVLVRAPAVISGPLVLLATVLLAERLARPRNRSAADAVLVAVGGVLIAVPLVGLLLDLTGIGLRLWSWTVALGVLALAGLVLAEHRAPASRRRPDWLRTPSWSSAAWGLATAAVVVLALAMSGRAAPVSRLAQNAGPAPVQVSLGPIAKTGATIVISAARPTGRLELRTQAADGTSISYPLMRVLPGHPVTTSVVLPVTGRFVITLNDPAQTTPLRSLILNR